LIELLIAVAIIGVLTAVAVFMYTKTIRKAKTSEVSAMMAEFKARQEQYSVENGVYLSSGANEGDTWPIAPAGPDTPVGIGAVPATWTSLKMNPGYTELYCAYVTIAGPAGGGAIGPKAIDFGMVTPPTTNWFYVLARCDFDSNPADFSYYFTRSDIAGMAIEGAGN
jgi:type II secretory pathway pseudopilin PulG